MRQPAGARRGVAAARIARSAIGPAVCPAANLMLGLFTVAEHQGNHIARINEIGVGDLGIESPDFGPFPRVAEEAGRYIPQGITLHYNVAIRVIGVKHHRIRLCAYAHDQDHQ